MPASAAAGIIRARIQLIFASTRAGGIGRENMLPWHIPRDMRHFKRRTTETENADKINAVLMGRRTWDSIPAKHRPLSGRLNMVVSSNAAIFSDASVFDQAADENAPWCDTHLYSALLRLSQHPKVETIFVIGGASIYNQILNSQQCHQVHWTEVVKSVGSVGATCNDDAFVEMKHLTKHYTPVWSSEPHFNVGGQGAEQFTFHRLVHDSAVYCRGGGVARHSNEEEEEQTNAPEKEERQYLDLLRTILQKKGGHHHRPDRTGVGTRSIFGAQMRFSLRDNRFPLLTTKRVFFRGVVEELLWMLRGSTDSRELAERGVHIWDLNGSREFLDSLGFQDREEGDLGPVYGHQWRHYNAEYRGKKSSSECDYSGQGVDQIAEVIRQLKTDPYSRRILLNAWNPAQLGEMALPPCHVLAQFYVCSETQELSCHMYQRSGDMGLGVPFNIAFYSLLTRMLAHVCGLKSGDFIHSIGDAHIYENHVAALEAQLENAPRPFSTLHIASSAAAVDGTAMTIDDFKASDFQVRDYNPHKTIPMKCN